jgi:hypothetical protein
MQDGFLDFGLGAVVGGLTMSACWGLFWLAIGTIGLTRGTCGWRVVLNSVTVLAVPLLLGCAILWARGVSSPYGSAFDSGLLVLPLVLMGFALRQAPDGQRAGAHMVDGIRTLTDELLGKHHECGGCSHEHDQEGCG